jgi:hypothetical protein
LPSLRTTHDIHLFTSRNRDAPKTRPFWLRQRRNPNVDAEAILEWLYSQHAGDTL